MKDISPFQIIVIGLCIALGVGGVISFALYKGVGQEKNPYGESVVIWGTLDRTPFFSAIETIAQTDRNFRVVTYEEKDSRTFQAELINALSEQRGPDIIVLTEDMLVENRNRIFPIPFEQYPERTFKDTYLNGAEVFMLSSGVFAIPFGVDPLMMYWNRDMFASRGFAAPPATWESLSAMTPQIVERTSGRDIVRAMVAFGEYVNVRNAKSLLATMLMQSGSRMAFEREGRIAVALEEGVVQGLPPAHAALSFFTLFSNPTSDVYTWNRALPQDRAEFLAGDLALYFGFASEVWSIRNGNPNLNFDSAPIPQGEVSRDKKGYGKWYGLAIMKGSKNVNGAWSVLWKLAEPQHLNSLATYFGFGSAQRSAYGTLPQDPFMASVARSALVSYGWLDPKPGDSDAVLQKLIDDIVSGRMEIPNAIGDATIRLQQLVQ